MLSAGHEVTNIVVGAYKNEGAQGLGVKLVIVCGLQVEEITERSTTAHQKRERR